MKEQIIQTINDEFGRIHKYDRIPTRRRTNTFTIRPEVCRNMNCDQLSAYIRSLMDGMILTTKYDHSTKKAVDRVVTRASTGIEIEEVPTGEILMQISMGYADR